MSINKLALIRYKTIDECLQNRFRKWTLEDLIQKVSEAVYEYEGIQTGVSKRTIQADIQLMRSDKLGYNAPIVVRERKYYAYDDTTFSITNAPINPSDVEKMREVVGILKQLNGFNHFEEMSDIIARLDNNLRKKNQENPNFIQFESNQQLRGMEYLMPLYLAILQQKALKIEYKSFKAFKPQTKIYYPYLLKEYRNRWFLIARTKHLVPLITLALDRIELLEDAHDEPYVGYAGTDFDTYFSDLIGVTKSESSKATKVILRVDAQNAPYLLTKPLHPSQVVLKQGEDETIFAIQVVLNFELEREILGFGDSMHVLAPRSLAKRIQTRLGKALNQYNAVSS